MPNAEPEPVVPARRGRRRNLVHRDGEPPQVRRRGRPRIDVRNVEEAIPAPVRRRGRPRRLNVAVQDREENSIQDPNPEIMDIQEDHHLNVIVEHDPEETEERQVEIPDLAMIEESEEDRQINPITAEMDVSENVHDNLVQPRDIPISVFPETGGRSQKVRRGGKKRCNKIIIIIEITTNSKRTLKNDLLMRHVVSLNNIHNYIP